MNDTSQDASRNNPTSDARTGRSNDAQAAKDALGHAASNVAEKASELYSSGKESVKRISDEAKAQPKPHYRTAPSEPRQDTGTRTGGSAQRTSTRRSGSETTSGRTGTSGAQNASRPTTAEGAQTGAGTNRRSSPSHERQSSSQQASQRAGTRQQTAQSQPTHRRASTSQASTARPSQRNATQNQPAHRQGSRQQTSQEQRGRSSEQHANQGRPERSQRSQRQNGGHASVQQRGEQQGRQTASSARLQDRLRADPRPLIAIVACVIVVLVVVGCWNLAKSSSSNEEEVDYDVTATVSVKNPISTAQSAWTQGEMPYLYQTDVRWADESYAGGTVAQYGSGPTSLAMVYIYLTGSTDMGIVEMCELSTNNGYVTDGGTSWTYMVYAAGYLGLTSTELELSYSDVQTALEAGEPVIMKMGHGTFATSESYIVLTGIDENGMVEVRDPSSVLNTARKWSLKKLLNQAEAAWAYTYY